MYMFFLMKSVKYLYTYSTHVLIKHKNVLCVYFCVFISIQISCSNQTGYLSSDFVNQVANKLLTK